MIQTLYETFKFGPTASNLCPMRVSFVTSDDAKAKVIAAAAKGNQDKIASAPLVAIIAYDSAFYDKVEQLAPHMNAEAYRAQDKAALEASAIENTFLQAGYLIIAARALGLDCGPLAGFDKQAINDEFYRDSSWRASLLINLGYGRAETLHPRGARLAFDDACEIR